jgi:Na+/H+-dicarboxylate symporter
MSLVVFTLCLLIGGFGADNGFGVTVGRALVAMAGTFGIALVIGLMARRMIEENVAASARVSAAASTKSQEKSEAK